MRRIIFSLTMSHVICREHMIAFRVRAACARLSVFSIQARAACAETLRKQRSARRIANQERPRAERRCACQPCSPCTIGRRAARMAGRARGELIGVHVASGDSLAAAQGPELDRQRRLVEELGGVYREVVGHDAAASLLAFARARRRPSSSSGRVGSAGGRN